MKERADEPTTLITLRQPLFFRTSVRSIRAYGRPGRVFLPGLSTYRCRATRRWLRCRPVNFFHDSESSRRSWLTRPSLTLNLRAASLVCGCYGNKSDLNRAVVDLTDAIRLNPKYADAYNGLGAVYANRGEYDKAIADFNEAIRLDPKDAEVYFSGGTAYHDKGEYDAAIADYTEAIRFNPKDADITFITVASHTRRKTDKAKAEADFAQAKKLGYKAP